MDTKLDAPAALGGGPVGIGLDGTLDLGCPLTIPSIATLGTPGTASTNGTIKDTSTSNAVTVLTIAGGSYAGEIEGLIRLVKIGPGELDSRWTDDQLDLHRDGTRRRRDRVGRWRELNERLRKLQSSRHTPCAVRPLCSA